MAEEAFDLGMDDFRASAVTDSIENINALDNAPPGEQAAALDALNEQLGFDPTESPITVEDGEVKINGEDVDPETITTDELNQKLGAGIKDQAEFNAVKSSLSDPGKLNVSKDDVTTAKSKAAEVDQTGKLEEAFNSENPTTDAEKETAFQKIIQMLKESNLSFMTKILKYTAIAGLSYAGLLVLAQARTACVATYGNQKPKVVFNKDTKDDCVLFKGNAFNTAPQNVLVACQNACPSFISGSTPPAQTTTDFSKYSATSCNCEVNGTLQATNVNLEYKAPGPFDIFGDMINAVGGFVTTLANGALALINTVGNFLSALPKILMWVGIAAAVVAVIVGIGFLAKKLSDKSKQKKLKGGGKQFKHWKHQMKQIQRKTPLAHLSTSNVFY